MVTCWYCPECETNDTHFATYGTPLKTVCDECGTTAQQVPLLVPGCDLPTLLREAGYDVREAIHAANDFDVFFYDHAPDQVPGLGDRRCLVVVLPDEEAKDGA